MEGTATLTYAFTLTFIISLAFTSGLGAGITPDLNVEALKGLDAKLPCTIDSQAQNVTVVWMDKLDNVLYYNENRMIDDERFTLSKLGRSWDLTIRRVDSRDEGSYRCVANTQPIQLKYYQLTVFIPPTIVVENSSPDVEAAEGTTVRLNCNATGYPTPTISWSFRRASEPVNTTNIKQIQQTGSVLQIHNVSKYLDEIYTCTASNGYDVPQTHDIRVRVRFKPHIRMAQKKVEVTRGESTNLTCAANGFRPPRMYFAKDGMEITDTQGKYGYIKKIDGYLTRLTLNIYNLQHDDLGYYKCVAINSLGRVEQFVEVKEDRDKLPNAVPQPYPGQTSTPRQTTKKSHPRLKSDGRQIPSPPVAEGSTSTATALHYSMHTILLLTLYFIV